MSTLTQNHQELRKKLMDYVAWQLGRKFERVRHNFNGEYVCGRVGWSGEKSFIASLGGPPSDPSNSMQKGFAYVDGEYTVWVCSKGEDVQPKLHDLRFNVTWDKNVPIEEISVEIFDSTRVPDYVSQQLALQG